MHWMRFQHLFLSWPVAFYKDLIDRHAPNLWCPTLSMPLLKEMLQRTRWKRWWSWWWWDLKAVQWKYELLFFRSKWFCAHNDLQWTRLHHLFLSWPIAYYKDLIDLYALGHRNEDGHVVPPPLTPNIWRRYRCTARRGNFFDVIYQDVVRCIIDSTMSSLHTILLMNATYLLRCCNFLAWRNKSKNVTT